MRFSKYWLLVSVVLLVSATSSRAVEKPVELKLGDPAPMFAGIDDRGEKWDSQSVAGKKILVVYFFPADMTPGCTKQACGYRDALAKLADKDVEVIGVSGDAVENHQHFKRAYQLNFTLLADHEGKIARAFGVKTSPGGAIQRLIQGQELTLERGVTAQRWTFVIDKHWRIAHKDTKVNAAEDSARVLRLVENLK